MRNKNSFFLFFLCLTLILTSFQLGRFFVTHGNLAEASHDVVYNFAKQMGGTGSEYGVSVTVDSTGNIYTTGTFAGTADFDPGAGTSNLTSTGSNDIFVSKLDSSGNFVWAKAMGGTAYDFGSSITVDSTGNIYTTGTFAGTADFDPGAGTSNLTSAGSNDIFVSKLDSSGNFVWAKAMGGTDNDYSGSVVLDPSGNIYITGSFNSTADFDPGAGTSNLISAGLRDAFITKLDTSGNFVFAKKMGGTSDDFTYSSMALDSSGNIYITGSFESTVDFDPGAGTSNLTSAGLSDSFIVKLDSSGIFVFAKKIGGIGNDVPESLALDSGGNVYISGYFNNTVDFDPGAGISNLTTLVSNDGFIFKLDSSGNFVWANKTADGYPGYGYSMALDSSGGVYTIGSFYNTTDFDPGVGVYNLTSSGGGDIYISKLDSSGNFVWAKAISVTGGEYGVSVTADSSGNVYATGSFSGTADLDPGSGTVNLTSAGSDDIFLLKLSAVSHDTGGTQYTNISGVTTSNITSTSAEITWNTDRNSSSVIDYGVGKTFDSQIQNSTYAKSHAVTLSNLKPETEYSFRIKASTAVNITTTSFTYYFTTLPKTEPTPSPSTPPTNSPSPETTTPTVTAPTPQSLKYTDLLTGLVFSSKLVKTIDNPTVYCITPHGKKLAYPTWESFTSYGYSEKDIIILSQEEINTFPDILYIQKQESSDIYSIDTLGRIFKVDSNVYPETTGENTLLINLIHFISYKTGI